MLLALAQSLTDLIAPPVCVLCLGKGQQLDALWGLDLCMWCEQACTPLTAPCPRCGEPGAPAGCTRCRSHPPPYDAAFCLFRYEDPVDLLVTNLKFRHELACGRVLGMLFARHFINSGRALPQCVVPVPLHASRYRERGFNQCAEIARHLSPRLCAAAGRRIPVRNDLLSRTRATHAQSELAAAERAANLAGAFRARRDVTMPQHIALLDDVMTTGHTAVAAAQALKEAGCRHVEIWACARAGRS
ncbi:MAG: ComF family protein [Pseudomonadota bacterium]